MSVQKVVCFGPGPKFKGGISNYNTSLAKAFDAMDQVEVHIVSWTQQYPAIIPREFVDKTSKTDFLENTNIQVTYITNYNNPLTWKKTADYIIGLKPDKVIFQWAIAIQGIPLGRIAKRIKRRSSIEVLFDLHFVIQKEGSSMDKKLTKFGIQHADHYVVHALKTANELKELFPSTPFTLNETGVRPNNDDKLILKLFHPIYDLFKPDPTFDVEAFKKQHGLKKHVFLFFGFIRKYKGLHHTIRAFDVIRKEREDVSLLICGESFWKTLDKNKFSTKVKTFFFNVLKGAFLKKKDDEGDYRPLQLIEQLGMEDCTMVVNKFVPNEEVPQYFQTAETVVLFYEYATPSGIESLSYNFKKPLLATRVGHFPETIEDGFNGYLANAEDINDMAQIMRKWLEKPLDPKHVEAKTKHMSWESYAKAILHG